MRIDTTKEGLRKIMRLNDGFTTQESYTYSCIKDGRTVKTQDEDRYYTIKDGELIRRSVARDSSYDITVVCDCEETKTFVVFRNRKLKFE